MQCKQAVRLGVYRFRTGGISVDISRDGITVAVMSLLIRTGGISQGMG